MSTQYRPTCALRWSTRGARFAAAMLCVASLATGCGNESDTEDITSTTLDLIPLPPPELPITVGTDEVEVKPVDSRGPTTTSTTSPSDIEQSTTTVSPTTPGGDDEAEKPRQTAAVPPIAADADEADTAARTEIALSDGTAVLDIPAWWVRIDEKSTPGAVFAVAASTEGFTPNVRVTSAQQQTDLEAFLDRAVRTYQAAGLEVLEHSIISSADGRPLARVAMRGSIDGGRELRFLSVADVSSGTVAIATFSATDTQWEELIEAVQPPVYTLRAGTPQ